MDRGAWWAIDHAFTKSWDMIEQLSTAQLFTEMCLSIQMQHPTYNLRESRPLLPKTHLSALG